MESIFDGWTKQVRGSWSDGEGGHCALGHIWDVAYAETGYDYEAHKELTERIGNWIIANLDPPRGFQSRADGAARPDKNPTDAIIWANNDGKLNPEGFRMVDLLTRGYVPTDHPAPVEAEGVTAK